MKNDLFDIGELKNHPDRLYDMAVKFSQFFECVPPQEDTEIWTILEKVGRSLWGNLPPVVVIDLRDPDDPDTWGNSVYPSFTHPDLTTPGPLF